MSWPTVTLGEIATFTKGSGLSKADMTPDGAVPCVHYGELFTKYGADIREVTGRTDHVDLPVRSKAGDVLMPTSDVTPRGLAKASSIRSAGTILGGDILVIRPQPNIAYGPFVANAIRRDERQVLSLVRGSTVYHLYAMDMRNFTLDLPSLQVQVQIADRLADADSLIAALERLVVKEEGVKQGLMQQLLTGATRLPGFTEPWLVTTAGEVGTFRGGSGFPLRFQGSKSGVYPFFKVSDMNNIGNEVFMTAAHHYISEVQRKKMGAVCFPANSIVFAKVGAAVFLERKRMLTQTSCIDNNMAAMLVNSARGDVRFVHYQLTNFPMASLVATTALPSLNGGQLRSIPLSLPTDLAEQRAIAAVLDDADHAISALHARIHKAKAIKQGMMQELLTRGTRLPSPEMAA